MNARSRSSGDLLADRRYAYADAAFREGDAGAAADLAAQTLERAPAFAPAHALLGRARARLGRIEEAVAALGDALALEPDDALGVRLDLAALGALHPAEAISPGYVTALFDDYAPRFDRHLVEGLAYRGPELLRSAVLRALGPRPPQFRFRRVLDLGCGTGLAARAFEGLFETIEGVDLSPRMLAQARATRLYAQLHQGDVTAFLAREGAGSADLILAADVFVYVARLEPVFVEAARVLEPGGLFGFTVQAHAGEGFVLGEDGRYAHGEGYLRAAAVEAGLTLKSLHQVSTRQDRGADVPGSLVVLAR